ncbi:type II toxin-antitoxin system PemK/MazF family toxin [Actimicrobium sp. CCI2.3]|uniref:type II toxin-antitoxin system PemK/MazF family toxin n=1 Tax=Actimicrobium sp. CCI2.3 TaxID=3048616 RepID=UPI002AB3C1FC|nr:type II toxin-antitoxin system PemK/MazF family toxin [Actimicrobium sp. CCI2.3]MDY7573008.1 type II toxin-antitoxin system PemK/MazF family toxin [Actimicrobium sp. CCI2.3]MEB0023881.1 type II toxin-antitoxin system PemK/MazF family toxin [Actimicrobium sp. CCI2.3]
MVSKIWGPDRQDIIWIDFNPQVEREMKDMPPFLMLSPKAFNARTRIVIGSPVTASPSNESNPFAVNSIGEKGKASYILAHQPKSFDWQYRAAKPHPWKKVPLEIMSLAGNLLNQIITIGD